jgi:hypothetical protein
VDDGQSEQYPPGEQAQLDSIQNTEKREINNNLLSPKTFRNLTQENKK